MIFQKAKIEEFENIKQFYWNLINEMKDENDKIGWKKGIYPTDEFLIESLKKQQFFTLKEQNQLYACVILNHDCNEGYNGILWSVECQQEEILSPHALAVIPMKQGSGIGTKVVEEIITYARLQHKKAVRLDILGTNQAAERLYTKCGFQLVQAKEMYYEDTGWTEYKIYELNL